MNLRTLLAIAFAIASTATTAADAPTPLAANARPDLLHSREDYQRVVPPSADEPPEITKARAEPGPRTCDENIGEDGSFYSYICSTPPPIVVSAILLVSDTAAEANAAVPGLTRTFVGKIEQTGAKSVEITGLEDWHPGSRFLVGTAGSATNGNYLIVVEGPTLYLLTVTGIGGIDSADEVRSLLEPKLADILAFRPQLSAEAAEKKRQLAAAFAAENAGKAKAAANDDLFAMVLIGGVALSLLVIVGRWAFRSRRPGGASPPPV